IYKCFAQAETDIPKLLQSVASRDLAEGPDSDKPDGSPQGNQRAEIEQRMQAAASRLRIAVLLIYKLKDETEDLMIDLKPEDFLQQRSRFRRFGLREHISSPSQPPP